MTENRDCSALILAGGRSRRMGRDKALISMGGETLLERAAAFWRSSGLVDRVLVAAGTREHLECLAPLPEWTEPVFDLFEDCGPMAGILSAFRQTGSEILCVSAVDMPFLTCDAAGFLLKQIENGGNGSENREQADSPGSSGWKENAKRPEAAVYVKNGRPEPLFGVYRRSTSDAAEYLLRSGRRKMSELLDAVETIYCPAPEPSEIFRNVNTPEDLKWLE